jgi:dipeptidyl aminopeptidase/acylaminoacyl peptidase
MKLGVIISFLSVILLLAGCATPVNITSDPDGADVRMFGSVMGSTPYHASLLGGRTFEIGKDGYQSKSLYVNPRNARSVHVVLEKTIPKISIESKPPLADVYDRQGTWLGQTPVIVDVAEDLQEYTVSKLSYPSKDIALTPSSPKSVMVDLGGQIQGMVLLQLVVTRDGIELRSETVFADRNVIEASPSVRAVRRLTDLSQTRWVGDFVLFPDGRRILMEIIDQEPDDTGKIIRYSNLWSRETAQDGRMQRWTDGRYFDESPCFSADGQHIYFSSSRSGKFSVFRMSTGGQKGLGLVTSGATLDRFPRMSPDGSTLLWTAYVPGSTLPQLWSLPLSSTGFQAGLPMQLREGSQPRWHPDGEKLLYSVQDRMTGKWKIWTMRPDGSEPTQITTGSDSNDTDPQWFPDGRHIIFASDRGIADGKPNYDIWVSKADGSDPKQLTTNGSRDDKPAVSQDGKTVFFRSNRGLKWDIWMMEIVDDL